jgi:hypothetical protein
MKVDMETSPPDINPSISEFDQPESGFKNFLKKLSPKQKFSLLFLIVVIIILPVAYFASTLETRLNSRAFLPPTPPTSITPIPSSTAPYPTRIPTTIPSSTAPYPTRIPTTTPSSTAYLTPTPSLSCNMTINPPKTCPFGYQCIQVSSKLGADGVCKIMPTPTPTSKPTYAPTPTPTITPNINPVIKTNTLGTATVPLWFSTTVDGYDQNTNDSLTMKISNLPAYLFQRTCTTSISNNLKNISCTINGLITKPGTYSVKILLTDNRGGKTEKTLSLKAKLWYQLFQTP